MASPNSSREIAQRDLHDAVGVPRLRAGGVLASRARRTTRARERRGGESRSASFTQRVARCAARRPAARRSAAARRCLRARTAARPDRRRDTRVSATSRRKAGVRRRRRMPRSGKLMTPPAYGPPAGEQPVVLRDAERPSRSISTVASARTPAIRSAHDASAPQRGFERVTQPLELIDDALGVGDNQLAVTRAREDDLVVGECGAPEARRPTRWRSGVADRRLVFAAVPQEQLGQLGLGALAVGEGVENAARSQHAVELGDRIGHMGHVVEHVHREDDVEVSSGNGKATTSPLTRAAIAGIDQLQAPVREVEADEGRVSPVTGPRRRQVTAPGRTRRREHVPTPAAARSARRGGRTNRARAGGTRRCSAGRSGTGATLWYSRSTKAACESPTDAVPRRRRRPVRRRCADRRLA